MNSDQEALAKQYIADGTDVSTSMTLLRAAMREIERLRIIERATTLALIPSEFRVAPTCEEASAYGVALGASIAAMTAALPPSPGT